MTIRWSSPTPAAGFITTQNGVYPDRDGMGVTNSFRYYNGDAAQTTSSNTAFAYWTDPLNLGQNTAPKDTSFVLVDENGHNAPAPWVPFTRAGCRVGYFGMNGPVLESTGEIPLLFPAGSQALADFQSHDPKTAANYVGVAVHCPKGDEFCAAANGGIADVLQDEPNGYSGFIELLGNRYIAPLIGGAGADGLTINDFNGSPIGVVIGGNFVPGFHPNFNGLTPPISLAYAAAMQEHGIPVTFTYISDAHDNLAVTGTFGPGEAGYVAQLKIYDQGFADFFASLAAHGIDSSNTLFVVTADEGDHFVGSSPAPAGCDGVNVPCTYSAIGEINADYPHFVGGTLPGGFGFHSDSAPATWVNGKPASSDLTCADEQTSPASPFRICTPVRRSFVALPMHLSHGAGRASLGDPHGSIVHSLRHRDYPSNPCGGSSLCIQSGFAWNHGDINEEIAQVWLGMAGPGVQHQGRNDWLWADHTDVRPTMLELLGLKDDYRHDGRVLVEALQNSALPPQLRAAVPSFAALARAYKQINAPFGSFGSTTLLRLATPGIASADPAEYAKNEALIALLTAQRCARYKFVRYWKTPNSVADPRFPEGHQADGRVVSTVAAVVWHTGRQYSVADRFCLL